MKNDDAIWDAIWKPLADELPGIVARLELPLVDAMLLQRVADQGDVEVWVSDGFFGESDVFLLVDQTLPLPEPLAALTRSGWVLRGVMQVNRLWKRFMQRAT